MAKDFTNTQSGGVGNTSQIGDKPVETAGINKPPGRPTNIVESDDDKKKKRKEKRKAKKEGVVQNNDAPQVEDVQSSQPAAPVPLESEKKESLLFPTDNGGEMQDGEIVEESIADNNIPLIAPIDSLEKQEEVLNKATAPFDVPENVQLNDAMAEKTSAPFGIPDYDIMPEGDSSPVVEPVKKEEGQPEIYTYGSNKQEYAVYEDKWYERITPDAEWTPIKEKGRVMGLNASARDSQGNKISTLITLPESDYKPTRGGTNFEGTTVYGYPGNKGTAYIIQNGGWYKMKEGDEEWIPITSDNRIKSLNDYHKTKVENSSQIKAKAANMKPISILDDRPVPKLFIHQGQVGEWKILPGTDTPFFKAKPNMTKADIEAGKKSGLIGYEGDGRNDDLTTREGDIYRVVENKIEKEQQDRILKALGDEATQAGGKLEASGSGLGKTDIDVVEDLRGRAVKQYGTRTDALFDSPSKPQAKVGEPYDFNLITKQKEWDEKYGPSMPVNKKVVEGAKESKDIILEDLERQLSIQESDEGRKAVKESFQGAIDEADLRIKEAQEGYVAADKSFQNRHDYMQSDEFKQKVNLHAMKQEVLDRTYGMYQDNQVELRNQDFLELQRLDNAINNEKLDNFINTDLVRWNASGNMTESQLKQLSDAQERAKNSLFLPFPGASASQIDEIEKFMVTSVQINNRLAEAANRGMDLTDVLMENKKAIFNQVTAGDHISADGVEIKAIPEVGRVFEATMNMRDFMSPYVNNGKITIDEISGRYDISDNVNATERAYIESNLSRLIDDYDLAKSEIYSKSRAEIYIKQQQLNSLRAAIAKANLDMESGDVISNETAKKQLNESRDKIIELKGDIRELENSENTLFLNDPNAISLDVASSATETSRQVLQAIPEGITPKQKFDMFYETLVKKNNTLAKKFSINQSYFDRTGEKLRDVLDWEYLGADLSSEEIEYYKNASTLRKTLSLYLNNDWGITEESAGFWSSFYNSFISTFAPVTGEANGFYNETSALTTISDVIQQQGYTDKDFADGMDYDRIFDRMDVDFLTWETAGSMIGTTAAIMVALTGAGLTTTSAVKAGKGIYRLMSRYKKLDKMTDAVKDFKRVEQSYHNTLNRTKFGRFINQTSKQGIQFESGGLLFNMDEELNFMSGMGGAIAGKGFEAIFKRMPPSKVIEWVGGFFGKNTNKAVDLFKRMGKQATTLRAAHYRGLGEMPEEFAQELIGIYRDELDARGFWEKVDEQYGGEEGLDNLAQLLVSSYILGAGMGTVMTSTQQDIIETMSPAQIAKAQAAARGVIKDMSVANANANITADRIVNNYEAVIDETVNPKRNKTVAETEVKNKTEADTEAEETTDKELPYGKLVYHQGQVGIWSRMPESGTNKFTPKPNMTPADILAGIESGTIIDMDAEAKADANTSEVETLRQEEQAELLKDIPNAENYLTDGKVDKEKITNPEDIAKFEKIYDKYDKIISPLLEAKPTQTIEADGVEGKVEPKQSKFQDFIKESKEEGLTLDEAIAKSEGDFQGKLNDAKERGLTMEEFASEQEADNIESETISLADRIRNKKIDTTGMMLAMPVPLVPIVNTIIETAAITVETIESIIKKIKDTAEYRNLSVEDRLKADEALNKLKLDVNETGVKNKVSKNPTSPLQQLKKKIATFKQGREAGAKENRRLTKEEFAKKKADIEAIQAEIVAYAKENLPKDAYNSQDITRLMDKVRKATTWGGVDNAIKAIDKHVDKFNEKARVNTIDRIVSTFLDPLTKKRGDKKVGKVTLKAREKLTALANEIIGVKPEDSGKSMNEVLNGMTQEELNEVEERVDAVISEGKGGIKSKEQVKKQKNRTNREVPVRVLSEQNKTPKDTVSGEKEVGDLLKYKQGVIRYDGEIFSGKQALDEYLADTGTTYDEVGDFEAILTVDELTAQANYQKNSRFKRATRKASDALQEVSRTLESRLMDVYRGSKELRTYVEDNVLKPINKAYNQRAEARREKLNEFKKSMNNIFGGGIITGLPNTLTKETGIKIKKQNRIDINNDQAVNIYGMSTVDPSMIYNVDGEYYSTEATAIEAAKSKIKRETGVENVTNEEATEAMTEVTDKYNVNVISQIGGDLQNGLAKIAEIESYIEKDPKLKAFADLISNSYKNYRSDYEAIFTEMYDLKFKDGHYVPLTRVNSGDMKADDATLLGSDYKGSASTAMSNHLKQKYNNSGATFDFSTGAYTKLLNYVNSMEHAKAFLPVAENTRNLINKTTKPQLIEKLGKTRVTELEYHLNDIITDGASATRAQGGKIINSILQWNVLTTLMAKTGSIPKQLTSATHWLGAGLEDGVGTLAVSRQLLKLFPTAVGLSGTVSKVAPALISSNESEVINAIFKSAFYNERLSGKDIDYETRKMFNQMGSGKGKNLVETLKKIAMGPTIMGDMGGVIMGGVPYTLAMYNHNVKPTSKGGNGMTHEEALEDALEKFVYNANKKQQSTRRDIISNAQTDPKYRLFLTYKTSQIAATAEMVKGLKILTDKKGGYTGTERINALRKVIYYNVSNSLFQLVAGGTLTMMYLDDDDDDKREKQRKATARYNLVMDTLSSNAQGLGIPGLMADFTVNNLRNRNVFNDIPVMSMIEDITAGGSSMIRILADEGDINKDSSDQETARWQKLAGVKNIINQSKSWGQFMDGDINAWDAFMGRQIDEDTGHMFVTGGEREDWIYGKVKDVFGGKEETESYEPFREGEARERMGVAPNSSNLAPPVVQGYNDNLLGGAGAGVDSGIEYTGDDAKSTKTSRNREEIKLRIKSEKSIAAKKAKTLRLIRENENERKANKTKKTKVKTAAQKAKDKREGWVKTYKKEFGKNPPAGMNLNDIISKVLAN